MSNYFLARQYGINKNYVYEHMNKDNLSIGAK